LLTKVSKAKKNRRLSYFPFTTRHALISAPPIGIASFSAGNWRSAVRPVSKIDLLRNDILAALIGSGCHSLLPHFQAGTYSLGDCLFRPEQRAEYIYFPQVGAGICLISELRDGRNHEVCMVGKEGVASVWELLGEGTCKYYARVQVPGTILRIRTDILRPEFKKGGVLKDRVLRYIRYALLQLSTNAACNRAHRLEQRLARWLLATSDRAGTNQFPATHKMLSSMLGCSRSEVTIAAGSLREAQLISYCRGQITILDHAKLQAAACECYELVSEGLKTG
jgi:CRP-like cAMP-binding protein